MATVSNAATPAEPPPSNTRSYPLFPGLQWRDGWLSNFATNESSGNPSFGPVPTIAQQKPLKHLSSAHMHVQMFPSHCFRKLCIRTTQ